MAEQKTEQPKSDQGWRNRIVGYGTLSPEECAKRAHDKNWRRHPEYQRRALRAVLGAVGWVDGALINRTTGNMIDGHLRVDEALKKKEEKIPVTYVELSPEEELQILATFDPIGSMARQDKSILDSLTEKAGEGLGAITVLERRDKDTLGAVLQDVSSREAAMQAGIRRMVAKQRKEEKVHPVEDAEPELPGVFDLKDDMTFEFGGPYDIPPLREDMLSDCPEPIITWTTPEATPESPYYLNVVCNGNCRTMPWDRTVCCFYTDDVYFLNAWDIPAQYTKKLLNRGFYAVMTPDFTFGPSIAKAMKIWNVWKQRWTGRYWQEAGLRIIPNVSHITLDEELEYGYAGIPKNAPCLSVQVQSPPIVDCKKEEEESKALEAYKVSLHNLVRLLVPQSLVVYGGKKREEILEYAKLPKELHVILIENFIAQRTRWLKEQRVAV